jgi:outer membrane protein assembly factor BamE (lipoprotein component of BamABCDE complex)
MMYPYRFLAILPLAFSLLACTPSISTRGHMLDADEIASLKPGATTRAEVLQNLGTPTSTSTFDADVWYYIGQKAEKRAFMTDAVREHQVVALAFGPSGVLEAMVRRGSSDFKNITPLSRSTPSAGKKLGFLEQLVGNLGKFNKPVK